MTRQGVLGRVGAERTSSPQRSSEARPMLVDPATLMRIGNLQLRARVVVEGFLSGLHRSPYHGFSVEFTEYRQYTPGDDPRYLDWKLYARTDRYYLKRFEDETNLRVWLLVDLSRSMSYGSVGYDKASYAKTAAATLGYFLSLQRDAVGLVTFDAQVHDYLPARYRPGHLHRLMMLLERSCGGSATDLASPLAQVAQLAHKRGMVVLLSDLLAPPPTLRPVRTWTCQVGVVRGVTDASSRRRLPSRVCWFTYGPKPRTGSSTLTLAALLRREAPLELDGVLDPQELGQRLGH